MIHIFTKYLDSYFLRFIISGVINTLFGTAIMFVFYNLFHFGYWVSSASNYIFGSILSYFFNKYYTFKNKDNSLKSIMRFILNISLCYFIAYGLAKPVINSLLIDVSTTLKDNISMILGMSLFVTLNYLGQRLFVFKPKS